MLIFRLLDEFTMKFTIKSFIGVFNLIEVLFALRLSGASYDQSIAYKLLPAAEKRQLQYQMLNLFGLDHRPKPKRKGKKRNVFFFFNVYLFCVLATKIFFFSLSGSFFLRIAPWY